ncbi:hypothetical protein FHR24_002036 [Wenyingzhuangia heitensis]|uniref:Uncharacterized protein n=1 Tax=Wenyingzhuangia heitensis TaxID=1487859 RepID=A0ABX0U9Q8_9FLAO|nr:hypothetical protein [Wenyingzhuangia heitensis]NIJ45568.1 hypothetical protein [Wenyingzhuangia heitensis]
MSLKLGTGKEVGLLTMFSNEVVGQKSFTENPKTISSCEIVLYALLFTETVGLCTALMAKQ